MDLKFYARGADLVSLPGERRIVGQPPRYVGRSSKPVTIDGKKAIEWRASEEPHCAEAGSEQAARLVKRAQEGSLWPADERTAAACGLPFVPLEFSDGEWLPAPPKFSSTQRKPVATPKD